MKKTEVLRRQVLILACIFTVLSAYLADSYLGVRVSATETLARLPASLVFGDTPQAKAPDRAITRLEIDCSQEAPFHQAIATKWLQLLLINCEGPSKLQILNTTNGSEAIVFNSQSQTISDLITLTKGENQLQITTTSGRDPVPKKNLLITLQ